MPIQDKKLSRRGLGLLLATAAAPLSARSTQAVQTTAPANDLDEARGRVRQQSEAVRKVTLDYDAEPAFRFTP